jgi:hypothetical protein
MPDKPQSLPPSDSWITLAPGEQMTIDPTLQAKWHELTRRGREIRGNVLAHCFGVEFTLDSVISRTFFAEYKSSDPQASVRGDCFDECVLKGRNLNFAAKIDLLRKLRPRISELANALAEEILSTLNEVRDIRNRFAHYPITFRPAKGPTGELNLSMWLECRDRSIELTDGYLASAGQAIIATQSALESANKLLHEGWKKDG